MTPTTIKKTPAQKRDEAISANKKQDAKKITKSGTKAVKTPYKTAGENLTLNDKMKILENLGQTELIEIFKDWQPRQTRVRRSKAPLDQKICITVTDQEKILLNDELQKIKTTGENITASQFIRNRATSSIDINGWKNIAIDCLKEMEEISKNESKLQKRKKQLINLLEETDDEDDINIYEREIFTINNQLNKILARPENRKNRLSGRMSMAEAETIKWRAQRLCLSSSDYLRMQIFGLEPNSSADKHMSIDAKRRFYISIIDVANNGWGSPPTIYECSQCGNYLDEIEKLHDRIAQLEKFV